MALFVSVLEAGYKRLHDIIYVIGLSNDSSTYANIYCRGRSFHSFRRFSPDTYSCSSILARYVTLVLHDVCCEDVIPMCEITVEAHPYEGKRNSTVKLS